MTSTTLEAPALAAVLDPEPVRAHDGATARVLRLRLTGAHGDLLDRRVFDELYRVGRRLARDREVRAVVLDGPRPGVFAPHFRLLEIAEGGDRIGMSVSPRLAATSLRLAGVVRRWPGADTLLARTPLDGVAAVLRTHEALLALGRVPQVVVAAIGGDALGGGCELALACDVRVMADGPWRIGQPELSAGIPPGAGGSVRLPRAVGVARALSMMLRCEALDPHEAFAAGLVDEVVPADGLVAAALRHARAGAALDPAAVVAVKRTVNGDAALRAAVRREAAGFVSVASSVVARSRLRHFAELSTADDTVTPWRDRSWVTSRPGGAQP